MTVQTASRNAPRNKHHHEREQQAAIRMVANDLHGSTIPS